MIEILKSATFDACLVGQKDRQARLRVISRIERLSAGNPGDVKPVGAGVSAQVSEAAARLRPRLPGGFHAARRAGDCAAGGRR